MTWNINKKAAYLNEEWWLSQKSFFCFSLIEATVFTLRASDGCKCLFVYYWQIIFLLKKVFMMEHATQKLKSCRKDLS